MVTYTVIVPAVHNDTLNRCLSTLDERVLQNVIVYANGPNIAPKYPVKSLVGTGRNDGVATAWNVGRKEVIENNQDYLIMLSQNVVFEAGMTDFLDKVSTDKPRWGTWSQMGWHCVALSRELLETVGEFDTNCYPAYYEDSEYAIRMHKLDILDTFYVTETKASVHSGFSTTLGIRPDDQKCKEYVIRKWGDIFDWINYHDQTWYDNPYNDPQYSLKDFERRTTEELIDLYGYRNKLEDLYIRKKLQ